MENDWQSFWVRYRNIPPVEESDLFYQVGKTVDKAPISIDEFSSMIKNIVESLDLDKDDILLELCCGNGLLTYLLSNFTKHIYAFDFAKHMIENAKKFKQKENITYAVGDAKSNFFKLFGENPNPGKILMNDSLAYFSYEDLASIITLLINKIENFSFYITGIPCEELKWEFYNTDERKKAYLSDVERGDLYNNGMGRWWSVDEIEQLAKKFNLRYLIEKPSKFYNYRMNVLLTQTPN